MIASLQMRISKLRLLMHIRNVLPDIGDHLSYYEPSASTRWRNSSSKSVVLPTVFATSSRSNSP